ncbi:MAG: HAD family hydrolase [Candidatus Eremiobacteraeota bacterium]|nr:HAD family hydrolase [Candidatus Eremiobacteraeota bacterium]
MRDLQAVLFDLDDTLHDDTTAYQSAAEEVAHEVAAEHGIDAMALKAAYVAEAEGFWKRLSPEQLRTSLSKVRPQLWLNALRTVGLDDEALARRSANNYYLYRKRHLQLFPGAVDLLQTLRARGIKLGILTNGVAETHHEKIKLLELAERFDAIFIADEDGLLKPDPLLFAHACRELHSPPSASAMVGDRYERDMTGALEAGLYTVWMNVRNETLPDGARPPHETVATLPEVAAALSRLGTAHAG